MRVIIGALILAGAATAAGAAARIVFAGGNWAAIDFGSRCEARSKALWTKPKTQPYAGFAFGRAEGPQGLFYAHLSRPARSGTAVMATIGSEPFLLGGKGDWAWSRSAAQRTALLDATRYGSSLRIIYRDTSGRRVVDHYALGGAATAIDAAAASCAGKSGLS